MINLKLNDRIVNSMLTDLSGSWHVAIVLIHLPPSPNGGKGTGAHDYVLLPHLVLQNYKLFCLALLIPSLLWLLIAFPICPASIKSHGCPGWKRHQRADTIELGGEREMFPSTDVLLYWSPSAQPWLSPWPLSERGKENTGLPDCLCVDFM